MSDQGNKCAIVVPDFDIGFLFERHEKELRAVAENHGFEVAAVYNHKTISGKNGCSIEDNPLLKSIFDGEVDAVAVESPWHIAKGTIGLDIAMMSLRYLGIPLLHPCGKFDLDNPQHRRAVRTLEPSTPIN